MDVSIDDLMNAKEEQSQFSRAKGWLSESTTRSGAQRRKSAQHTRAQLASCVTEPLDDLCDRDVTTGCDGNSICMLMACMKGEGHNKTSYSCSMHG